MTWSDRRLSSTAIAILALCGVVALATARHQASSPREKAATGENARAHDLSSGQPGRSPGRASSDDLDEVKRLSRAGRYEKAEKLARRILASRSSRGGPESRGMAEALQLLVDILLRRTKEGNPETARLAEQSVSLSWRIFGESHPSYGGSLVNLGTLFFHKDDFEGARSAYQRALAIFRKDPGPESPEVALTLSKLAAVEGTTGHFQQAQSLMEQAVSTADALQGIDDPDLAGIYHNYGTYLSNAGDLLGAEKAYQRALEIRQSTLPTPHPSIAYTLMALGYVREELGDYASARTLLEKALAMTEETLGPHHRQVAQVLSNLALLYSDIGRPDLAIPYQERSVSISRAVRGEENSKYWQNLSELGMYKARAGDDEGALALLRPALAGQERKFGSTHQEVATTLLRLAGVEARLGDAQSAAGHYRRAIEIYRQLFGPDHFAIALGLDGLSRLKVKAGDLAGARELIRRALELQEKALGPRHPDVAKSLVDLAKIDWGRGNGPSALRESLRAEAILRDHFGYVIRGFSQREALAYQRIRKTGLGVALSVLAGTPPADRSPEWVGRVWDAVIRSRAIVLDQMASRHQFVAENGAAKPAALAKKLAATANRLASLAVKGPDLENPQSYRFRFEKALAAKEKVEHEVAEEAASSGGSPPVSEISLDRVRETLPEGTGLLAFVEFHKFPGPKKKSSLDAAGSGANSPQDTYGALVSRKGDAPPSFIELGSAGTVDATISEWRREMRPPSAQSLGADSGAEERYRLVAARLRQELWDPVAPSLRGLKQVLIVPEGGLYLVNFAVLPLGDMRYLLESAPLLHYLSTERDLLTLRERHRSGRRDLLMGGPEFEALPPSSAAAFRPAAPPAGIDLVAAGEGASSRGAESECENFQNLRFGAIQGAANEVAQIKAQILSGMAMEASDTPTVGVFTGLRASEPSFKKWAPGSRLLHIATHAFFLGAGCDLAQAGGSGRFPQTEIHGGPRPGVSFQGNPLLLSGLALAGANRSSQAGPDADDGILTSEEIASMDLSSVQWVVLSACETGLGEIEDGEGVFGLRRAFQLAGARTIIMSLWKVDDQATLEWMRSLYEGRGKGLSTAQAVRWANLSTLRKRRARGASTHPFYWGAFVAAGDWR